MARIVERARERPVPREPVPDQGLSVVVEELEDECRVALLGELDVSTAPRLNTALADARIRRCSAVIIDLSELKFMDSTGLSAVLVAEMHARTRGQRFAVVRGPRHVQELFRLTGVDHFLEVIDAPGSNDD